MSITRDSVQGFIDGYKATGGNTEMLRTAVEKWLATHPQYPSAHDIINKILDDLESYRK